MIGADDSATNSPENAVDEVGSAPLPLEWEVRLGEQAPHRRLPILLAAGISAVAAYLMLNSLWMAVIAPIIILASTIEMFLPVSYRLSQGGARAKCGISVTEMIWPDVKRIIPVQGGLRLSPFARPNRMDNFRGVLLRFSGNEADVWAKLRELQLDDEIVLGTRADSRAGGGTDRPTGQGDQETEDGGGRDSRD